MPSHLTLNLQLSNLIPQIQTLIHKPSNVTPQISTLKTQTAHSENSPNLHLQTSILKNQSSPPQTSIFKIQFANPTLNLQSLKLNSRTELPFFKFQPSELSPQTHSSPKRHIKMYYIGGRGGRVISLNF